MASVLQLHTRNISNQTPCAGMQNFFEIPEKTNVIVVGSGPNGLAAAITMAQAGYTPLVIEAADTPGGAVRSSSYTIPGFTHDVCSAVFPMAKGSAFFQRLDLAQYGLSWIEPPAALAHPFDNGTAALLFRSIDSTADTLSLKDSDAYKRLMKPLAEHWENLFDEILAPPHFPLHLLTLARFGIPAMLPAQTLARGLFRDYRAQGLFAGIAAHSFLPLSHAFSSTFALVLGVLGHVVGWPIPSGGSQFFTDALVKYLASRRKLLHMKRVDSIIPIW